MHRDLEEHPSDEPFFRLALRSMAAARHYAFHCPDDANKAGSMAEFGTVWGVYHALASIVMTGEALLLQRLTEAGKQHPQPELQLSADRATQYQTLAEVMAAAAKSGVVRIGFVSDPRQSE